jgi:hypothetical protein
MSSKNLEFSEGPVEGQVARYKIAPCSCRSEYQDKKYGKGMRVFTGRFPSGKLGGWRCTVCGKTVALDAKEAKKISLGGESQ